MPFCASRQLAARHPVDRTATEIVVATILLIAGHRHVATARYRSSQTIGSMPAFHRLIRSALGRTPMPGRRPGECHRSL